MVSIADIISRGLLGSQYFHVNQCSFQGSGNNSFGVHRCETNGSKPKQILNIAIDIIQVEEKYHPANPGVTLYWDNLQQGVSVGLR